MHCLLKVFSFQQRHSIAPTEQQRIEITLTKAQSMRVEGLEFMQLLSKY